MGEGFKQVKTKYIGVAAVISAILGLSFGGIAFGAQLLLNKLVGVPFVWLYCILICIAAAIVCGGVAFLLLYPRDKKIAKELDNVHSLNEKVQTALAYKDGHGEVVEMLQSDTDARLRSLPKLTFGKWLKNNMRRIVACIVLVPLAVGIVLGGLLAPVLAETPQPEPEKPTEDTLFSLTESQIDLLQTLCVNVNASNLSATSKAIIDESLNRLLNNLMFADLEGELTYGMVEEYVEATMYTIQKTIKDPLSYKELANALGSVGLNELAKMIADGVQVYKNFPIADYGNVESFDGAKASAVEEAISEQLTEWLEKLSKATEPTNGTRRADGEEQGEDGEQEEDKVTLSALVVTALGVAKVDESDGLRSVLYEFAVSVALHDNVVDNNTALKLDLGLNKELSKQTYSLAMYKYLVNNLCVAFGLDVPDDENFEPTYSEKNDGDEGNGNTQGGFGKGDMLYGSDDKVYDPSTGEYVTYGELLNEYYAIVESLLREGNLTEEQQTILRYYFDILFSGIKAEE